MSAPVLVHACSSVVLFNSLYACLSVLLSVKLSFSLSLLLSGYLLTAFLFWSLFKGTVASDVFVVCSPLSRMLQRISEKIFNLDPKMAELGKSFIQLTHKEITQRKFFLWSRQNIGWGFLLFKVIRSCWKVLAHSSKKINLSKLPTKIKRTWNPYSIYPRYVYVRVVQKPSHASDSLR